jgi:two-component sensor histidine kinase
MPFGGPDSERALILLRTRDGAVAAQLLAEAAFAAKLCTDVSEFAAELDSGAGFAVIAEEFAMTAAEHADVTAWVRGQPAWSDFPIIAITRRIDEASRIRAAELLESSLGNVSFLERPFHPTTLTSLARSALRSRRRQYDARSVLNRYELLARELQHRTKNLLSVILSVASASLREGGDGPEAFVGRLHSLAKAQDLIFEEEGRGAVLGELIHTIMQSFGSRISMEGPSVYLKASVAQSFALVVHELATNAVKYGALTKPSGRVSINWTLDAGSEEPTVSFTWRERGGPPAKPPEHRGFGSLLLEKAIASPSGPPRFDFGPEGLTYEITALCR